MQADHGRHALGVLSAHRGDKAHTGDGERRRRRAEHLVGEGGVVRIEGFAFSTDAQGRIDWAEPRVAPMVVGALLQPAAGDRLTLQGDTVLGEERLLNEIGERVRDVRVGPDGNVYVVTDEEDGKLLRIEPPKAP